MPAFGNTGPWKKYLAYGIGQEQLSGMAHMTGYDNDGPIKSGINHGDPITGSHAAGVILAALRYRKYTADEKRELIDAHYLLMIKTAKRGLDMMYYKVDNDNK